MNKILATFVFSCSILTALAQDSVKLKLLTESNQYDEAIRYASQQSELSAPALYYLGLAYYMKEDDANCLKFMELSIDKNNKDARPYYIKANTFNYMGKYNDAIPLFKTAIALNENDARYYSGLGDSYYQLKQYDMALQAFKKASEMPDAPDHALLMMPQLYSDLSQPDKALAESYNIKSRISRQGGGYNQVMFNIGLMEINSGNYDKAEVALKELTEQDPSDYQAYTKLIQICYHRKEYDKAKPYRDKLYEAYKNGELKNTLKDMFCFDQFKWNDKLVQVFERYQEGPSDRIYNKHLFYIVDKNDKLEFRIQTEYSPISIALGGAKYLLCASINEVHVNYGIGINDDFKYEDLKNTVIKILEKKYNPVASTTTR